MNRFNAVFMAAVVFVAGFMLVSTTSAQSEGGVTGKVRSTKGDGIPNASITARQKGVDIKTVSSDRKGEFVMTGLRSGRYNLVFDAPGYSSGVLYNVEVEKKKIEKLGDRLVLSPDQGTQVIIKGSVFYREGTSITGAEINLERVNADGSTKTLDSTTTTIQGEFTFRRPEGVEKLRIRASFKGIEGSKDIAVDAAAIYRLAITLDISRTEK
ncbi:MAG: carboxypeptidase-like regulatory domain-containing protein [Pyrinomonadaceae bacterium]